MLIVISSAMFLLLNVAVGGEWPGNPTSSTLFPQKMQVDYIRVYKNSEDYDTLEITGHEIIGFLPYRFWQVLARYHMRADLNVHCDVYRYTSLLQTLRVCMRISHATGTSEGALLL